DGLAARDLIGEAGGTARVKIKLDVQRVPNLKSGTVWGTLPGATDETLVVVAHRDGWFEGANDNAAGIATMLGLAEYFAKVPRAERRRTIVFLGTTGHHNSTPKAAHCPPRIPRSSPRRPRLLTADPTAEARTVR